MTKKLITTIFLLCLMMLPGCASRHTSMIHPATQDVQYCSSSGWGWFGAPYAIRSYNICVNQLKRSGYEQRTSAQSKAKTNLSNNPVEENTSTQDLRPNPDTGSSLFSGVPEAIQIGIKEKCDKDFPSDFSSQANCARSQVESWKVLNQ